MLRNIYVEVKTTKHGAWYLWSLRHQKELFLEHWHVTFTVTFLFTQVGVAFLLRLNIWIQSGSTMCICDELLTIVVITLANRFVHGPVPTAVFFRRLTYKIMFFMTNTYIFLPHPLFSLIISSDAMKELKFIITVSNTQCCSWYKKTIEEVIEIYQNYRVIQYSFNILRLLVHL